MKQVETELKIFESFAEVAGLRIDSDSVVSELPPKPDISCKVDGQIHHFELTEATEEMIARRDGSRDKKLRGGFHPDDPLIRAISAKTKKNYPINSGKLELIVYYDKYFPPNLRQRRILKAILYPRMRTIMGDRWFRIWVYDNKFKRVLLWCKRAISENSEPEWSPLF